VEKREPTNVISNPNTIDAPQFNAEWLEPTKVEMGETTNTRSGVATKPAKAEPTRRLSIDLPERPELTKRTFS